MDVTSSDLLLEISHIDPLELSVDLLAELL